MENTSSNMMILNCPSRENDDANAKKEGPKLDDANGFCIVLPTHYDKIERFNRWRPNGKKIHLSRPYHQNQKDDLKHNETRFDHHLKGWNDIPNVDMPKSRFSGRRPNLDVKPTMYSFSASSISSSPSPKKTETQIEAETGMRISKESLPVHNDSAASLNSEVSSATVPPRIEENQLQEQSRHDDHITRCSPPGENTQNFSHHLNVGSVLGKQAREVRNALYIIENIYDSPKKKRKSNNEEESSMITKDVMMERSLSISVSTFNLDWC